MIKDFIRAGKGEIKSDLVLKNANVVNVFTHEIIKCDVAIEHGITVGLGNYFGENEIDLEGKYLMPSFIDSHVHIESSMLTPSQYAEITAPWGVTCVIADPHEIVNVCGEKGFKFMLSDSANLPFDFHFMLPSCVPATPLDSSGCTLDGSSTVELFNKYKCFGLGEMMNYPGVMSCDEDVLKKLGCTDNIDGHAPGITGNGLNAYISAGIRTDHECETPEELVSKVSLGMYVFLREGSHARNINNLYTAINSNTTRRLCFCTDDKNLDDIVKEGTISYCVKKVISLGVDPIDAIIMASLNAAECYGLKKQGAVAPGFKADYIVTSDLSFDKIDAVYKDGIKVAENGLPLFRAKEPDISSVNMTVRSKPLPLEAFTLPFDDNTTVIEAHKNTLYTTSCRCSSKAGLDLAMVIERHHDTGNIGRAYVKGFNVVRGAVAQTVGHDSHNICVVGDNAEDMKKAYESLGVNGGICVVRNGIITGFFKLPVAGLMSDLRHENALNDFRNVSRALAEVSDGGENDIFMSMSFLSLIVIPETRLTDKGIFDVKNWKFLDK